MNRDRLVMGGLLAAGALMTATVAALSAIVTPPRTVHAEVDGPCTATINGVDVVGVDSHDKGTAIKVKKSDRIELALASDRGLESHDIKLEFFGRKWTADSRDDDGDTSWSDYIEVDDYATYGVGLYRVFGVVNLMDGSKCVGGAYVQVEGNPLTTVAGAAATAAAGLGTAAALGSTAVGAMRPGGGLGGLQDMVEESFLEIHDPAKAEARRREAAEKEKWERAADNASTLAAIFGWCGIVAVAAASMTLASMVGIGGWDGETTGSGGGGGANSGPIRLPRAAWRPKLTVLGIFSGLLAGLGLTILLQQYAIAYPDLSLVITWLALGAVVYGLVFPTLGRTIAWARVNGRIAALERGLTKGA